MSFNFSNTVFSSTPAKPSSGFGNFSFGATSTAPPAFGAQTQPTTGFGAQTQQTTGFGAQTQVSTGFGVQNQSTTGFGAPNTFGQTGGGFGATAAAPTFGFGAPQTSAAPAFGVSSVATGAAPSFGFGATTAQAPTLGSGGFSGFGATISQPSAFGALGTTTTSAGTGFGAFGTGGFGGFGATNTTSTAGGLSGGFGTTFGSNFGKPAAATGFGTTFGQPTQQQQQQQQQQQFQQQQVPLTADEALAKANVSIFGDERDTVIAKWNNLQAMWGTGRAFYNQNSAPIEITPHNFLCRFKTISYSKITGRDNKLGYVSLTLNKLVDQVKTQQQQLIDQLKQIFGNNPNLTINIDNVKALSEGKCQVIIFIEEKSQSSNETKRYPATEVASYLNQPMPQSQMTNLGVEQVLALVQPDEDQLKKYLENPPQGIHPRMWQQAKEDNPDPTKFIPVPIIGFNELRWRIKCQESETDIHMQYLAKVQKDVTELKQRHASTVAKIMEQRRKYADLSHRILQIIVKQESTRKMGVAMSPEEEILRSKLENMQALVSAPTQFKGRLSELLSRMRMQRNQWNNSTINEYTLDTESSEEMKTFLTMQQKAIEFLIETVNKDMKSLKTISDGMGQLVRE